MNLREEFRWRKLGFGNVAAERFCVFQWRTPGLFYLVYRLAVAAYTLTWLCISSDHFHAPAGQAYGNGTIAQAWGAYLTNWTYILLTIYFLAHALVALIVYSLCRGAGLRLTRRLSPADHLNLFHEIRYTSSGYEHIKEESSPFEAVIEQRTWLPWYMAVLWILFAAVGVSAIMVTVVFWAVLVPVSNFDLVSNDNLQLHLINSVLVLLELALTAVPIHLLHVVYPILYGLIYMLFSLIYWVDDHSHVIYFILDWGKPGQTIGYIVLVGFVIMPIIHFCIYGIYCLKIYVFRKIYRQ